MAKHEEVKNGVIFPIGEKNDAYAQYFDTAFLIIQASYIRKVAMYINVSIT